MIKLTESMGSTDCELVLGYIENYVKPKMDRISGLTDRIEKAIKKNQDILNSEVSAELDQDFDDEDFSTPLESTIFKVDGVFQNTTDKLCEIEDELFDTLMALKKL